MSVIKNAKANGMHIGYFDVTADTMKFNYADGVRRKDIIDLGDIVYFMFVDDKLMKIGKAGGANGFAGRIGTYNRGRLGDQTNKLILDVMEMIDADRIDVLAVQSPRKVIQYTCNLTGDEITEEVPTHKNNESRYTHMFLGESIANELPFCKQLN